ncbi:uncharacterized protein BDR25DRAFT_50368 [Lindgomyces ingoldianus]|uniref:Uncharacterized protein n=1 Tax=Lindgomyces ingoldianus TaxID=673940 RepID=A0ACB6QS56_9PLEO|nr:uncharacterized protein BDR25DRAFT_50368 [Lindgomyces ingoldianus]KAF2469011.1 hypothetical protein BDR25DRAFT_50368 [Lindgomyces ingoldianus]
MTSTPTFTPPTPSTWTLRLKNRKTTVLLHVNPLNTFTTIKTHLLAALRETTLKDPETGDEVQLPSSPSEVQFARPVNINHPELGFVLGEWEQPGGVGEMLEEEESGRKKGKGRPKKDDELAGMVNVNDCPKGAGLRDGAVLAFRWKGDEEKGNKTEGKRKRKELDVDMEEGEADMWGVKLASYEDQYGVENTGDVGGGREFEG